MKFQAAFAYLKNGHRLTLPEWGGYWTWCDECKTIVMHARDGGVIDIRDSVDMDYTLAFTFRDDWELLAEDAVTEHDLAWEDESEEEEEDELAEALIQAILLEIAEALAEGDEDEEFDLGLDEICDCVDCCCAAEEEEEEEGVTLRVYLV